MTTTTALKRLALCATGILLLAGCATDKQVPNAEPEDLSEAPAASVGRMRDLNALIEAPDRMQAVCTSTEPFSAKTPFNKLRFWCPSLDVTATLDEIRDAGWQPESLDIGEISTNKDGLHTMPVKITIRKLQ